jgi:SAM-dependent methyltransferase
MLKFSEILIKSTYNFKERVLFDIRYGIETSSPLLMTDFQHGQDLDHGKSYYASSTSEVYQSHAFIFNLLQTNLEKFVFIDLGCGKGKVCILWELLNKKKRINQKIIGIDYYLPFIEIANNNYQKLYKKKGNWILSNIKDFDFKEINQPLILYLYNPFDEVMLEQLLINIKDIPVYIIYNIPMHWDVIDKYGYRRIFYKTGKNQNQFTVIYTNM